MSKRKYNKTAAAERLLGGNKNANTTEVHQEQQENPLEPLNITKANTVKSELIQKSIYLTPELNKRLKQHAVDTNDDQSTIVRKALEEFLK